MANSVDRLSPIPLENSIKEEMHFQSIQSHMSVSQTKERESYLKVIRVESKEGNYKTQNENHEKY